MCPFTGAATFSARPSSSLPPSQIPALLPRSASGRLLVSVESEEGQQRALQAFLHYAAADATSPVAPVCDLEYMPSLVAYLTRGLMP